MIINCPKHALILGLAAALACFAASSAPAADMTPQFDVSGIWSGGNDPGGAHIFQGGSDVKGIYVNKGFVQYFSGKYVTPLNIEGIWLRKNRGNGCVTKMKDKISVKSADNFTSEWVALDSNCDLAKGKTGSGMSHRQKNVEEKLWY